MSSKANYSYAAELLCMQSSHRHEDPSGTMVGHDETQ